jgi:argininosuccinate lyase
MLAVMQWTQDHDWAPSAGNRQQGESIMKDKNLNMPDHPTADVWSQHLHEIDLLNRAADENTARYLARFREDTRRGKALLKENLEGQQNAKLTRVPFWIIEK